MIVEIPLSGGGHAIVDVADTAVVSRHAWRVKVDGPNRYACRTLWRSDGSCTTQYMHQLITGWSLTDHINGDGLDNTRANLRPASPCENQRNQRKTHGTSRYKGVCWFKATKRWHAQLGADGKRHHLGFYLDEVDAALAYDEAARRLFGEFAAVNFPAPGERSAIEPPQTLILGGAR